MKKELIKTTIALLKSHCAMIDYFPEEEDCRVILNGNPLTFTYNEIIDALVAQECLEYSENGYITHLDGRVETFEEFKEQLDANYLRPAIVEIFEKAEHNYDRIRTAIEVTNTAYEGFNSIEKKIYDTRLQTIKMN